MNFFKKKGKIVIKKEKAFNLVNYMKDQIKKLLLFKKKQKKLRQRKKLLLIIN